MKLRHTIVIVILVVAAVLLTFAATTGAFSAADRSLVEAGGAIAVALAGLGFTAIAALIRYWK
jgi:hypothetical protein